MADFIGSISLNGSWDAGTNRIYRKKVNVPGLAGDPKLENEGSLWYRRKVKLPKGEWSHGTLILKGARFCSAIYVNGKEISRTSGGMAPVKHLLELSQLKTEKEIILEIELKSLKEVEPGDASCIPVADRWRSNVSSCLWDDVVLRLHGGACIHRLIPAANVREDSLAIRWEISNFLQGQNKNHKLLLQILDQNRQVLLERKIHKAADAGEARLELNHRLKPWSPEEPNCYILKAALYSKDGLLMDHTEMTLGLKEFSVHGLGFKLNHNPIRLRAGSVVWHRWLRDPEAYELAFDEKWFEKNIIERLKDHGANTLRFHLGMPPERFLDLCDRHGLIVQAEWIFFHGMKGQKESLLSQWREWLDLCVRHPSICIIHPWNETEGEELKTAIDVLEALLPEYPPLVISHRDVIHIHKYWWSLFENLGLYYDSAAQFDKPIMVDEFGGNYLDGEAGPGAYPNVKESFLRFLGRDHTREMRLLLNRDANAKIAEYWRRIGAAGFSPFCILGSPEDGNHHFLGPLTEGNPKPVWHALTAAYSPLSCSLDVWDRNFSPDQEVSLPVYFFNDTDKQYVLNAEVMIVEEGIPGRHICKIPVSCEIAPYQTEIQYVTLMLPEVEGDWIYRVQLRNPPERVKYPVTSEWAFRTITPKVPELLAGKKISVPLWEKEIRDFLVQWGFEVCDINDDAALTLASAETWERISEDKVLSTQLEKKLCSGGSVILLDIGPGDLGQGYLEGKDLGPLQSVMTVQIPKTVEKELFCGVKLLFSQVAEPESCIHKSDEPNILWEYLSPQATWLWNGLRGGLIVPAWSMEIDGLGAEDILKLWMNRGAEAEAIVGENYYAYELAGFYAFSVSEDAKTMNALREKVRFLVEDAPSLKMSIDTEAPIKVLNLSELYASRLKRKSNNINVLVNCGKNLTRTPVIEIDFGERQGKLILSQLLSKGRLMDGYGSGGNYGIRKDPTAIQFVLNMLAQAIR